MNLSWNSLSSLLPGWAASAGLGDPYSNPLRRHLRHRPSLTPLQACGIVTSLVLTAVLFAYTRSSRSAAAAAHHGQLHGAAAGHGVSPSATAALEPGPTDAEVQRWRAAAKLLDTELMQDVPQQYNESMLNPCWQSVVSGKLRCLPHAYISGFHTGAGALAKRLAAHPNILLDAGSLSSWGPSWGFWSEYRNTMRGYLDGIGEVVPELTQDPQHNIVIDGSMSTLGLYWAASGKAHRAFSAAAVGCWAQCDREHTSAGPKYEACMEEKCLPAGRAADQQAAINASLPYSDLQLPLLMRAVYGQRPPRFVFLLRNPVDRAYSAFYGLSAMTSKYGNHSEGFLEFVADQLESYQGCVSRHSEEDCIMRFETLGMQEEKVFYHCDQLFRGMYAQFLKVWFRFFPRSSFLILQSEKYFEDPRAGLTKVLHFLGLPVPESHEVWAAMDAAGLAISNVESRDTIPEGARRFLAKLYDKHNQELAKLLGDDAWLRWNVDAWQR